MDRKVKINNGEITCKEYNENLGIEVDAFIEVDDFAYHYDSPIELAEDLTIEGFFNALFPYFDIIDEHFVSFTRGFKLQPFYEQLKKDADLFDQTKDVDDEDMADDISHIEMYWSSEKFDWEDRVHSKIHSCFKDYGTYHGVNKNPDGVSFGLSFTSLNNWKHYRFVLNETYECRGAKREILFISNKSWHLFDLLRYFLYELTFHGYPEDAEKFSDSLKSMVDNISEEDLEDSLSLNELQLLMLNDELKEATALENYTGAQKIKEEIEKIKEEIEKEQKQEEN